MSWFSKDNNDNNVDLTLKDQIDLLLECSNDLVLILDVKSHVINVNNKIKEIFDISKKDVIGKSIEHLPFLPTSSDRNKKYIKSINDSKNLPEELDGKDRYQNNVILEAKIQVSKNFKVIVFKEIGAISRQQTEETGLQFLSEASLKLLELMPEADIYQYVANQLAVLVPDSYIFINKMISDTQMKTIASATSSKVLGRGLKVIGGTPVGKVFNISKKAQFNFHRGKIEKVRGGVHELTFGKIPKPITVLAEKVASIKAIFSIGFFWKGEVFGSATIINRKDTDRLSNAGIIETFINLASVALQRRRAEDKLKETITALDLEKIKVTREKDKLDIILRSIGEGVFVVDAELKILAFNQTATAMTGFSTKDTLGKKYNQVLQFVSEEKESLPDFIEESMKSGEIQRLSNKAFVVCIDKTSIPVDNTASPLKNEDGKVIGCVIVFRDVTSEREIDRAKSEFVSLASHQLRSPLASINWNTEMFLKQEGKNLEKKQKDYINEIYNSSKRMSDLVKSLLNVSRLELGTFMVEPKEVDPKEMVDSVLDEVKPKIEAKKQKVSKKIDNFKMNADPQLLRIIFQNLFTNAVKYTPDDGEISILITKSGIAGKGKVLIEVSDTGCGIPKKQQKQIFTKLFRADNVKLKEPDGNGLGLYIIKEIVTNSGGKIWFTSKENKGTSFYIEYPASGMTKKTGAKEIN